MDATWPQGAAAVRWNRITSSLTKFLQTFPIDKPITDDFVFFYYFMTDQPIKCADLRLWEELWGEWLKVTGKGQGCVVVWYLTPYFWLFYFTPTLTGWCNALPNKVPKRIIQKKRQQQIRDEYVSFILSFIYWVQQSFHGWGSFSWIHRKGWIPHLRCQKYVNRFPVCRCLHLVFQASIRVSFLLEVCQSPVRVSL